jgi:hypothetical protein
MTLGKRTKSGNCVFAKGIPSLQWTEFENREVKQGRPAPNPDALVPYPPTSEKKKEKRVALKPAGNRKLRKEGEFYFIFRTPVYGQLIRKFSFPIPPKDLPLIPNECYYSTDEEAITGYRVKFLADATKHSPVLSTPRKGNLKSPPSPSTQGARFKRNFSKDASQSPPAKKAGKETGGGNIESVSGKVDSFRKPPKIATKTPKASSVVEAMESTVHNQNSQMFLGSANKKQQENRKRKKEQTIQESKRDTYEESENDGSSDEEEKLISEKEASEKSQWQNKRIKDMYFEEVEANNKQKEDSNSELDEPRPKCDVEE